MVAKFGSFLLVALAMAACAAVNPAHRGEGVAAMLVAEPWPEADRLFFANPQTPQWKGADVANSVDLGDDRILWVFGDTLVAQPGANRCDRFDEFTVTVHNSIALQTGSNPTTAAISHFWGRSDSGEPESFFAPDQQDGSWFWMGGVSVFRDQVLVFLMQARSTIDAAVQSPPSSCAGLDFEILGWQARIATISAATPEQWQWRKVRLPEDNYWQQLLVGSSTVNADDTHLYAWSAGPADRGGNPVYLARWPLDAALGGDLSEPYWLTADGWKKQSAMLENKPAVIVADGNNEISVVPSPWPERAQSWWWLQSRQVMNSTLCYRSGDSGATPGECRVLFSPPELARYPQSRLLVYAPKWHPALTGQGRNRIAASYVVNSCDLEDIQDKCDLYYPRFIKVGLQPRAGK